MPTVLREGPYVFAFFASDRPEPRHIHVKRDDLGAEFWLDPVSVAKNYGSPNTSCGKSNAGCWPINLSL